MQPVLTLAKLSLVESTDYVVWDRWVCYPIRLLRSETRRGWWGY